jgi:hypothetical protein
MKPVVIETMWQGAAGGAAGGKGKVLLTFSRRPLFEALFAGAEAAESHQPPPQQQQQRSTTTLVSLLVA